MKQSVSQVIIFSKNGTCIKIPFKSTWVDVAMVTLPCEGEPVKYVMSSGVK